MPARDGFDAPVSYLAAGQDWPGGRLLKSAPPEARLLAALVGRLKSGMGELSAREVARRSGLSHQTVANLLAGRTWGDTLTIARLERTLGMTLWGTEHHEATKPPRAGQTEGTGRGDGALVRGTRQSRRQAD